MMTCMNCAVEFDPDDDVQSVFHEGACEIMAEYPVLLRELQGRLAARPTGEPSRGAEAIEVWYVEPDVPFADSITCYLSPASVGVSLVQAELRPLRARTETEGKGYNGLFGDDCPDCGVGYDAHDPRCPRVRTPEPESGGEDG